MRKEKEFALPKKQERQNRKNNDIIRLFECLHFSESIACCQKSRYYYTAALWILLKKKLPYP